MSQHQAGYLTVSIGNNNLIFLTTSLLHHGLLYNINI